MAAFSRSLSTSCRWLLAPLLMGACVRGETHSEDIASATEAWMNAVVRESSPTQVASLFCEDGVLVATAGVGLRMKNFSEDGWGMLKPAGTTIESYFDWFATLPDQNITRHHHNIQQVADGVWVNNAWVQWTWEGNPGLVARMTFVFCASHAGTCIAELHSSQLPERPDSRRLRGATAENAVTEGSADSIEKWQYEAAALTAAWMDAAVEQSNPSAVASLFCEDGILVATAGVGLRMQKRSEDGWGEPKANGTTIESYFDWFATLPEQGITRSHNNMLKLSDTVTINNAWVNWVWAGNPGLTARMTFMFRADSSGSCISLLHSSQLPASSPSSA